MKYSQKLSLSEATGNLQCKMCKKYWQMYARLNAIFKNWSCFYPEVVNDFPLINLNSDKNFENKIVTENSVNGSSAGGFILVNFISNPYRIN